MKKRILSILLLVCMLVNNLPVAALAEEAQFQCGHTCDGSCGYVAASEEVACDKGCQPETEGGEITITIGYKLKKNEKSEGLAVYYVDDQGRREACWSAYDAEKEQITFKTTHLSVYLIASEETPEQTAAAAAPANNTAQKTEASAASAVPVVQPAPRSSSHLPWIMAGLVSVAAALSVYLFFLLRKKGKYQD